MQGKAGREADAEEPETYDHVGYDAKYGGNYAGAGAYDDSGYAQPTPRNTGAGGGSGRRSRR